MAASPNKQTGFISAKEPPPTVMNDTTDGSTKVTNEKVIAKKTCRHFTRRGRTKTVSDYLKIFVAEKDEKKRRALLTHFANKRGINPESLRHMKYSLYLELYYGMVLDGYLDATESSPHDKGRIEELRNAGSFNEWKRSFKARTNKPVFLPAVLDEEEYRTDPLPKGPKVFEDSLLVDEIRK
jgi:hypothetical protein